MEKTWSAAGTYAVTLTVAHPGGPAITAYRYVAIENELPAGPVVERRELRTLSFSDWNQTVHALWTMKSIGMYDHLVYLHQVQQQQLYLHLVVERGECVVGGADRFFAYDLRLPHSLAFGRAHCETRPIEVQPSCLGIESSSAYSSAACRYEKPSS